MGENYENQETLKKFRVFVAPKTLELVSVKK